MNRRVSPEMDTKEVILALASIERGGFNPGAASCLAQLVAIYGADGLKAIKELDALGFYGTQVWMIYKDVFKEDLQRFFEALQTHGARDAVTQRVLDDQYFAKEWTAGAGG
jgi:hypothetical protein